MLAERDFDVLYDEAPGHIRSNANLPGHFIYPLTRLSNHAEYMESLKETLEEMHPETDWQDYGMPNSYNPVGNFVLPYSQFSRAESMKGSEQVVRGFQGFQPEGVEGIGEPNLAPKNRQSPSVIVYNGVRDGIQQKKRGRFSGFGKS